MIKRDLGIVYDRIVYNRIFPRNVIIKIYYYIFF